MSDHYEGKKLLLDTSFDGMRTYVQWNGDGKAIYFHEQDQQAMLNLLDQNKAMYTHNDGYSPSRELRRVATIPNWVAMKWLNEEGWWYMDKNAKNKLYEKLDSNEWQFLRTAPGRLGKPKE